LFVLESLLVLKNRLRILSGLVEERAFYEVGEGQFSSGRAVRGSASRELPGTGMFCEELQAPASSDADSSITAIQHFLPISFSKVPR